MRISTVNIKNFRSLRDVRIRFDDVTTFIGPNGTGKSTALRALDWFFKGGKAGELSEKDCSNGILGESILVEITFSGITEFARKALGKYAPIGVDTFTAWKQRTPQGEKYLSANAKGFALFTAIKEAAGAAEKKELYKSLRESNSELELPPASTGPAILAALASWEASNTERLDPLPENLQTNFFASRGYWQMWQNLGWWSGSWTAPFRVDCPLPYSQTGFCS